MVLDKKQKREYCRKVGNHNRWRTFKEEARQMRKKSHISLAGFLVKEIQKEELTKHKKAFYLGSILPDCKPSFLTTKHEFNGTFSMVQQKIEALTDVVDAAELKDRVYIRRLGEVIHYIADYFTFPHNTTYTGNLKDHCFYEKELKHGLRSYIRSGQAEKDKKTMPSIYSTQDLFTYIQKAHQEYASLKRDVEEDCIFIVRMCNQVMQAILQLLNQNRVKTLALVG